jgi:hypothetical protein
MTIDIKTGDTFGRLTAIRRQPSAKRGRHWLFEVRMPISVTHAGVW